MTLALKNHSPVVSKEFKILLFDLALGGHHGNYIRYLVDRWLDRDLPGSLDIVVLPQFLQFHHDVVDAIPSCDQIKLIPLKPDEAAMLKPRDSLKNRTWRNFQEWNLLCRYAKNHRASECLMMYFDTCELPLATKQIAPCPISGIYFKPTFHYRNFSGYHPSRSEKIQQWREKITLPRILRHPQLKTLFCLDPLAVEPLKQFKPNAQIVYLPDPVETASKPQDTKAIKEQLGIDADRLVLMFFGALDSRKGLYQLIEALAILPPEICRRITILLIGKTNAADLAIIKPQLKKLRNTTPLQIVEHYQFVPESEVAGYFQTADLVLAPYQKHVGMSGILLLAAAANKPVLSSDYGLMGQMVQKYGLGIGVDSTSSQEIALGITQFVLTCCLFPFSSQ